MIRAAFGEGIGSLLLTACVVGSDIMGERLADGNAAIALLGNTLATVAVLAALISVFGPISGAHFNPLVSLVAFFNRQSDIGTTLLYVVAQLAGCCAGALLANAMFELPLVNPSAHARSGGAQWLSEVVATAGLIFIAFRSTSTADAAWRVALWIGAAYWFTASTSFANPAITVARSLSDTFAGIRAADVPGFVGAQVAGAALGMALLRVFAVRKAAAG
jgi:glycerol uptake facilitator-like aquaporin